MAVWRSQLATAKLKSANISYLHIYVWRSLTKPPNLNPPIFLQWRFRARPPNLIPANISGYTVVSLRDNLETYQKVSKSPLRQCCHDIAIIYRPWYKLVTHLGSGGSRGGSRGAQEPPFWLHLALRSILMLGKWNPPFWLQN